MIEWSRGAKCSPPTPTHEISGQEMTSVITRQHLATAAARSLKPRHSISHFERRSNNNVRTQSLQAGYNWELIYKMRLLLLRVKYITISPIIMFLCKIYGSELCQ